MKFSFFCQRDGAKHFFFQKLKKKIKKKQISFNFYMKKKSFIYEHICNKN